MSRPNGHTVEEVIIAIRKNYGLLSAVARELGVERQTIYNYVKKYPTVRAAVDESRETIIDMAEGQLYKAVKTGSIPALMFLLKTVGKSRGYVERQEVTGADQGPLVVKVEYVNNWKDQAAVPASGPEAGEK